MMLEYVSGSCPEAEYRSLHYRRIVGAFAFDYGLSGAVLNSCHKVLPSHQEVATHQEETPQEGDVQVIYEIRDTTVFIYKSLGPSIAVIACLVLVT